MAALFSSFRCVAGAGHHLLRRRLFYPLAAAARLVHDLPTTIPSPSSSTLPTGPSRILVTDPGPPTAASSSDTEDPMHEFLSRFVHSIRGKLVAAFPGIARDVLDQMLLVICRKVIARIDERGESDVADEEDDAVDKAIELSDDLWATIWDVSREVQDAMRRDRMRAELRKYMHCDEVKEMCQFAMDIGVRGAMLRDLRFKWAREKLEEVEFYQELNQMHETSKREQEANEATPLLEEKADGSASGLTALPQRKGKIKFKIHGLDLSGPKWAAMAERLEKAQVKVIPEAAQPIEGKSRLLDERVLALDEESNQLGQVLDEWKHELHPKRVDWLALLDRIKAGNADMYLKVSEHLLEEESFESTIRDYTRLIDLYSKAERIKDAERIIQKMNAKGMTPDIITNITLVHMYSKAGNLNAAKEAFQSLLEAGFTPDIRAYDSMLTAYIKAGLPREGDRLMREMERVGVKPTKKIYMELLRAFAEHGDADAAMRVRSTMEFDGIEPSLEDLTVLIKAYGDNGNVDQARANFEQLYRYGFEPDDRSVAMMIKAYMHKRNLADALDLLLELETKKFKPGNATNAVLIDWFAQLQLVEEVECLVAAVKASGDVPFEINVSLCDMYARGRKIEKARELLKVLEGQKELLKADQFERIVGGLQHCGLVDEAKRVHGLMQAQGFKPSDKIQSALRVTQLVSPVKPQPAPTRKGGKA